MILVLALPEVSEFSALLAVRYFPFLRERGPRILRSIPNHMRIITGSLDSLGDDFSNMFVDSAFLLDSGNSRTRQSTEPFERVHSFST